MSILRNQILVFEPLIRHLSNWCISFPYIYTCFTYIIFKIGRRSDEHDDRGQHETGPDPSAPVTRRGVLTSFLTGKPMDIPEHDVVCTVKFMAVIPLSCQ